MQGCTTRPGGAKRLCPASSRPGREASLPHGEVFPGERMDAWGEVERAMGKVVKAAREQGWVRELDRIRHEIVWREDQAWFWAQVRQVAVCQAIDAILEDEGLLLAEG